MNKHEKEIAKAQLSSEEKTLKELQQVFKKARQDVQEKISELNSRTDMQNLQSIIYQKKYQQAILDQINEALADLKSGQYKTVEEYLTDSYDNGYIGMMYSLQSQGIPMTIPINDRNVVKAMTTDSKLSSKYYQSNPLKGRLAENVDLLKQRVRSNLSRGIIAGKSWLDVAVDIASGMNNPFDIALKDAMRIVRTEGHRVHQQGFLDAGDVAKSKGADILKQWDATMDRKTRPAHQQADGQIVEWDDYFTVGGEKMKAPSVGGSAKNVCNCRCQLLQRARWALDEAELETLQKRSEYFGLDKSESFEDYKQKYLKLPEKADTMELKPISSVLDTSDFDELGRYMKDSYGIGMSDSVKNLNFKAVKESTAGIEHIIKEFPQAKDTFKNLKTSKSGVMCATFRGEICFNPSFYNDYDKVSGAMFQSASTTGFHVKGNNLFSTGSHEAGHILELALNYKANGTFANATAWTKCTYAQEIVSEASKIAKKTPEGQGKKIAELTGEVSKYAQADKSEALAECVADYVINGENASILSKEVWKILKRELG